MLLTYHFTPLTSKSNHPEGGERTVSRLLGLPRTPQQSNPNYLNAFTYQGDAGVPDDSEVEQLRRELNNVRTEFGKVLS